MSIIDNDTFRARVSFPIDTGSPATSDRREPLTRSKANRLIKEMLFSDERFGKWLVADLHKLADDLTGKLELPDAVLPWTGGSETISSIGRLVSSGTVTIKNANLTTKTNVFETGGKTAYSDGSEMSWATSRTP